MNSLFGAFIIVGAALVPTAYAQGPILPPVAIFTVTLPQKTEGFTIEKKEVDNKETQATTTQPDQFGQITKMVEDAATEYGLGDVFLATLTCESNLNPGAVGDHGTSFGVAQIHLPAHPEISEVEALDPGFAIDWAARQFAAGNAHMWSCYNQLAEV